VAEGCLPRLWSALGDTGRAPRWDRLDELSFLLLHGVLHLLGHDHIEAEDAARMEAEEARLLPFLLNRRRGAPR
jgi:probable rRNA maturation factor